MPIVLIAAAVAALGLSAREVAVRHEQHDVLTQAEARMIAVRDPSCQDSLRFATTDSARATIVDGCANRIIANRMHAMSSKRMAESK